MRRAASSRPRAARLWPSISAISTPPRPASGSSRFTVYTGRRLVLTQFGAAFSNMAGELTAAWRDRTVRCLLLEDLEELARYTCAANGTPAEIRIFKSNLAILPQAGTPVQWRLAEIDTCTFDNAAYQVVLQARRRAAGALEARQEDRRMCSARCAAPSTRCTRAPRQRSTNSFRSSTQTRSHACNRRCRWAAAARKPSSPRSTRNLPRP